MQGVITHINPSKVGRNVPVNYYRVTFRLENGTRAVTDLCEQWRNFKHWRQWLKVGVILSNLHYLDGSNTNLNADFKPVFVNKTDAPGHWGLVDHDKQLELF